MSQHSRAEVSAALNYLCHGNGGFPLSLEQLLWELHPQNGVGFGECLTLAGANPDIFPDVLEAPFMTRTIIPRPNSITEDGRSYVLPASYSWDALGRPPVSVLRGDSRTAHWPIDPDVSFCVFSSRTNIVIRFTGEIFQMVTRSKRQRRKELDALKNTRCAEHYQKGCDNSHCRAEIRLRFYSHKKRPQRNDSRDVQSLFALLRQPKTFRQGGVSL